MIFSFYLSKVNEIKDIFHKTTEIYSEHEIPVILTMEGILEKIEWPFLLNEIDLFKNLL